MVTLYRFTPGVKCPILKKNQQILILWQLFSNLDYSLMQKHTKIFLTRQSNIFSKLIAKHSYVIYSPQGVKWQFLTTNHPKGKTFGKVSCDTCLWQPISHDTPLTLRYYHPPHSEPHILFGCSQWVKYLNYEQKSETVWWC